MPGELAAFMSYVRFNDVHDDGQLSQLRDRLGAEVRAQTGREFVIFQDRTEIAWGQNWQRRIDEALDVVTLLVVVITPGFFVSAACRAEMSRFLERERELGRSDLILPVYYISAREMEDPAVRETDELAMVLASRQFADWRELRFEPFTSPLVRKAIAQLASRMRDTFWQQVKAPPTKRANAIDQSGGSSARGRAISIIEVAIGYGGTSGRLRAEVVRSPAGEASAEVRLDADVVLADRAQFEQMLLVSGVAVRSILSPAERAVQQTGRALFAALLGTGEVAGRYRATAALADQQDEELRIVLRLDSPKLAGLPWEAMYDPDMGDYVCRHHQLVRHIPVASVPPPLSIRLPLRVLGVVAAPRGLTALDSGREREQLKLALTSLVGQGLAELTWAPSATWDELQEMLLSGSWHVLHFIGHGDFDADRDEGVLALAREDGRPDFVEAARFANLLRQARPMPRLVVLNSCSGAATSSADLFSGTAATLVRSGVAAVTAMQYSISDVAAVAFARGFYTALAYGRGIDQAMSAGRIAIVGTSGQTFEWITPVMYLRGHSAQLFALPVDGSSV